MKKNGQVWTADFFIGLTLFIVVIFVILKILMSIDLTSENSPTYIDAVHLSSELLSSGYPSNWTIDTVIIPGIAQSNKINATQLDKYDSLDYDNTIVLYHVSSDYLFFFSNSTDVLMYNGKCIHGYPAPLAADCTVDLSQLDYDDLSKIDRIVLLEDKIVRMTVYAWK